MAGPHRARASRWGRRALPAACVPFLFKARLESGAELRAPTQLCPPNTPAQTDGACDAHQRTGRLGAQEQGLGAAWGSAFPERLQGDPFKATAPVVSSERHWPQSVHILRPPLTAPCFPLARHLLADTWTETVVGVCWFSHVRLTAPLRQTSRPASQPTAPGRAGAPVGSSFPPGFWKPLLGAWSSSRKLSLCQARRPGRTSREQRGLSTVLGV